MSIPETSDSDKFHKKLFHRRNDSGELDVFEAARYFSGATEVSGNNRATLPQKIMRGGRISIDMPLRNAIPSENHGLEKQMKEKKYKQPRSPGGRLASFLNSLFNQTSSKKKKSKSSSTQSMKDEDESPGGRRKRRSSISHFRSSSSADSKSIYSSSNSGFRTPPPCANTPIKTYKDVRSYSDHKCSLQNNVCDDKNSTKYACLDEKFKFTNGFSEKFKNSGNGFPEKERNWAGKVPSEEKEFRKFNKVDEGAESDSSSDLFELENYDLGYYSSGLPVYETTHMDSIKRGAPISNGAI